MPRAFDAWFAVPRGPPVRGAAALRSTRTGDPEVAGAPPRGRRRAAGALALPFLAREPGAEGIAGSADAEAMDDGVAGLPRRPAGPRAVAERSMPASRARRSSATAMNALWVGFERVRRRRGSRERPRGAVGGAATPDLWLGCAGRGQRLHAHDGRMRAHRSDVIRRRRLAALGVVARPPRCVGAAVGAGDGSRGDSTSRPRRRAPRAQAPPPKPASSRAAGARSSRATASSPSTARRRAHELGALGHRLARPRRCGACAKQAEPYAQQDAPGAARARAAGRRRQPRPGHRRPVPHAPARDAVIRRYLRAARRAKALLVLDIQPGHADFLDRDAPPRPLAARARRRPRARPRVAHARRRARHADRLGDRPRTSTPSRATSRPSCASTTCPRSSSSCTSSRRT